MQTASTETEMKMEEKKELEGCNKKTSCFRLQQQRKLRGKEKINTSDSTTYRRNGFIMSNVKELCNKN